MYKLTVNTANDERLYTVGGDGKKTYLNCETEFEVDSPVEIIEEPPYDNWEWYHWLLWIVFLPIVGLTSCVLMLTDPWYESVRPYTSRITLAPEEGKNARLHYFGSKYDKAKKSFSPPEMNADNAEIIKAEIKKEPEQIKLAFTSWVRRLVSVFSVVGAIFAAIGASAISRGSAAAAVISFAALAVSATASAVCFILTKRQCDKLFNSFIND